MYNKEQFRNDFFAQSQKEMIDYLYMAEECPKKQLVNIGIISRLKRKKTAHPSDLKHFIKWLIKIKFITEENDILKLNPEFKPKNQ